MDAEWLQILRAFNPNFPIATNPEAFLGDLSLDRLDNSCQNEVLDLKINPALFEKLPDHWNISAAKAWNNSQTEAFCTRFHLTNFPWLLQQ